MIGYVAKDEFHGRGLIKSIETFQYYLFNEITLIVSFSLLAFTCNFKWLIVAYALQLVQCLFPCLWKKTHTHTALFCYRCAVNNNYYAVD